MLRIITLYQLLALTLCVVLAAVHGNQDQLLQLKACTGGGCGKLAAGGAATYQQTRDRIRQIKPRITRLANTRKVKDAPKIKEAVLKLRGGFSGQAIKLPLSTTKILLQALLTTFNVLCWAIPLRSRQFTQNASLLSLGNAFAGGIFLMLSFCHLLPEAIHAMSVDDTSHSHTSRAMVFCLVGFMTMLFIEKVAFIHDDDSEDDAISQSQTALGVVAHAKRGESIAGGTNSSSGSRMKAAMALCFAMSIHSFFEAAALGLATDRTSAYMMSACIALHQPAESIALLIAFLKSGMSVSQITAWLTGFSAVAMVGVSAGVLVKSIADSRLEAIIMAITAGTFIYVGATEIANEEFEEVESMAERVKRFSAYVAGMILMGRISAVSEKWEH